MDFTPFPTGLLPCPLRGIVVEGAQAIDLDEAFVAVPQLVAAASAIGTSRQIRLTGHLLPGGDKSPDFDSASGGFVATHV